MQSAFREFRALQEELTVEHMVDALVADVKETGGSE